MKKQLLVLVSVLALNGGIVVACQPKCGTDCNQVAPPVVTPPVDVTPPAPPVVPPAPDVVDNSTPPAVQPFIGK